MKKKGCFFALGYDANASFLFPEKGFFFLNYNPFKLGSIDDRTVTFNTCTLERPDEDCFKITWELIPKTDKPNEK